MRNLNDCSLRERERERERILIPKEENTCDPTPDITLTDALPLDLFVTKKSFIVGFRGKGMKKRNLKGRKGEEGHNTKRGKLWCEEPGEEREWRGMSDNGTKGLICDEIVKET